MLSAHPVIRTLSAVSSWASGTATNNSDATPAASQSSSVSSSQPPVGDTLSLLVPGHVSLTVPGGDLDAEDAPVAASRIDSASDAFTGRPRIFEYVSSCQPSVHSHCSPGVRPRLTSGHEHDVALSTMVMTPAFSSCTALATHPFGPRASSRKPARLPPGPSRRSSP